MPNSTAHRSHTWIPKYETLSSTHSEAFSTKTSTKAAGGSSPVRGTALSAVYRAGSPTVKGTCHEIACMQARPYWTTCTRIWRVRTLRRRPCCGVCCWRRIARTRSSSRTGSSGRPPACRPAPPSAASSQPILRACCQAQPLPRQAPKQH